MEKAQEKVSCWFPANSVCIIYLSVTVHWFVELGLGCCIIVSLICFMKELFSRCGCTLVRARMYPGLLNNIAHGHISISLDSGGEGSGISSTLTYEWCPALCIVCQALTRWCRPVVLNLVYHSHDHNAGVCYHGTGYSAGLSPLQWTTPAIHHTDSAGMLKSLRSVTTEHQC